MFTNDLTRRKILSGAVQISVGGAVLLTAAACGDSGSKQAAACVDPDKLSSGEKSLRASLHYVSKSPDTQKTCSGCSFWEGKADKAGCGDCKILRTADMQLAQTLSWLRRTRYRSNA
jgi:hypothetical protein